MKRIEPADQFEHSLTHAFGRPVFDPDNQMRGYTVISSDTPVRRPWWKLGGWQRKVIVLTRDNKVKPVPIHARTQKDLQRINSQIKEIADLEAALKGKPRNIDMTQQDEGWRWVREKRLSLLRRGINLPR